MPLDPGLLARAANTAGSAWVLKPGPYRFFLGADVRSAAEVGAWEAPQLRVVEQLAEACAVDPAAQFRRMKLRRDDTAALVAWEDVPVRTVDLRRRILDALPAEVPVLAAALDAVVVGV